MTAHPERHSFPVHFLLSTHYIYFLLPSVNTTQRNTTQRNVCPCWLCCAAAWTELYRSSSFLLWKCSYTKKMNKQKTKICHTLSGIEGRFACFIHVIYYCCCFTTTDTAHQEKCECDYFLSNVILQKTLSLRQRSERIYKNK